jgi:hypothetical protein
VGREEIERESAKRRTLEGYPGTCSPDLARHGARWRLSGRGTGGREDAGGRALPRAAVPAFYYLAYLIVSVLVAYFVYRAYVRLVEKRAVDETSGAARR